MKRMKGRLLTALMSLAMVFTMMPIMGAPVYADDPAPAAPGIALGPDVLSVGSNTSGAATVHMAGTKWCVIGYGGQGVASSADTMTLIAVDLLGYYGTTILETVMFRDEQQAIDANFYIKSNLKNKIDKLTGTGTEKIFSDEEKAGIVPRDLESEGYASTLPYTNGIAGEKVEGALLWPLSTQEAYYMDGNLRKVNERWWLRSPGNNFYSAASVYADGDVRNDGTYVRNYYGVRPAFNFNLGSVIFTSAAAGGKSSGDVGAGSLKEVETNETNEWKMTVESGHENFTVIPISKEDYTLTVEYSGAVTSSKVNEYVSAIVTDKDRNVTHYGNIKQCTDSDDESGEIEVDLSGTLECESPSYVYIFNEQVNGDKKTDYSSSLTELYMPATGHNMTPHDPVAPTCTEDGEVEYWSCGKCNKNFADEQGITELDTIVDPRIGHKYGTWTKLNATQHQKVCEHDKSHVEKENHKWDAGKETKKATEKQTGVRTYTCTVCKATKTETIPKLKPTTPKTSGTPLAKATVKKKSMTIGWNKIQGAEGYDIFFALCNHSGKKIACKNVKTIKGNKTFKWTKSGLKNGTAYKFYVRAYITKNGKKTYVSKSPMFHAYTGNGTKNYTNAKSVTVNKTKVTLKKGKTFKIKAKVNKVNKKKKLMAKSHAPTLRYMTSNKKVATVNSSGKITAKGKGTCYIYVFAHNGVSKSIKVTVP